MFFTHALRRAATVSAVTTAGVVVFAGVAVAHVTVTPESARQGDFTTFAFNVPNEEATADTTKLVVDVPTQHPIAFLSVRPVPGWTPKVQTTKLDKPVNGITEAVTRITWSGGKIKPHQFQLFEVSGGPLPKKTNRLSFAATQTYSNGKVVKWDDAPKPGGGEPEHPAPTLKLTAAGADTRQHTQNTAKGGVTGGSTASDSGDTTARALGGAALAVAVLGLIVAFVRRRRDTVS